MDLGGTLYIYIDKRFDYQGIISRTSIRPLYSCLSITTMIVLCYIYDNNAYADKNRRIVFTG